MGKIPTGFSTWISNNKKANTKSRPIRTTSAQPTATAGKGLKSSSKTSFTVPNNSKKGETKLSKPKKIDARGKNVQNTPKVVGTVGKVSKTTHASRHSGRNTKNRGFAKSSRVNHSLLRKAK